MNNKLNNKSIKLMLDELAQRDQRIADAVKLVGYPVERINPKGFAVLLRVISGQQLSVKAAATIHGRVEALLDHDVTPDRVLALDEQSMRTAGVSRQKYSYSQSLAEAVKSGALDFDAIEQMDDEDAIAAITQVKGLGRWSAEMYIMFSMGRRDIWPIDDLAVRNGIGRIVGHEKPTPKTVAGWGEDWKPYRSAVALLSWHYYSTAPL